MGTGRPPRTSLAYYYRNTRGVGMRTQCSSSSPSFHPPVHFHQARAGTCVGRRTDEVYKLNLNLPILTCCGTHSHLDSISLQGIYALNSDSNARLSAVNSAHQSLSELRINFWNAVQALLWLAPLVFMRALLQTINQPLPISTLTKS